VARLVKKPLHLAMKRVIAVLADVLQHPELPHPAEGLERGQIEEWMVRELAKSPEIAGELSDIDR